MNRKKTILLTAVILLVIGGVAAIFVITRPGDKSPATSNSSPVTNPNLPKNPVAPPVFDKNRYPLDSPSSLWAVINKKRPLPANYTPSLTSVSGSSMQPEAAEALEKLRKASSEASVSLKVISGYRSYATQQSVYTAYVNKDGQAAADTYSARPGHSEHQTGLAADLGNAGGQCDLEICFATTTGGTWLAANAHTYGFTIRYIKGKESITGYQFEPWHIRYVGQELAGELYKNQTTLEEFFELGAAAQY